MLKIGIVGLPNVGKSTLFRALTRQQVDVSNYPFCTIDPNVGIVKVPDERLDSLSQKFPRLKVIPAAIEFIDIAGLTRGAADGQGLGNKFLSHIREVDAVIEIIRVFEDINITHIEQTIDSLRDIEIFERELILADLETINSRIQKTEKAMKGEKEEIKKEYELLQKLKKQMEGGKKAGEAELSENEIKITNSLFLLTSKPIFYLYNYSGILPILSDGLLNRKHLFIDAKLEMELSEMEEGEKEEVGIKPRIFDLIKESYNLLDLITFYTMNENETRAWETKKGTKAPQAGGKIHSDFEEKFIRAEIVAWDKLIESGSWHKAREHGFLQIAGRDYIVKDGDVIYFLI